jgi:hypothetical protein
MRTFFYLVALATTACMHAEATDQRQQYDQLLARAAPYLASDETIQPSSACDAASLADRGNVEALHERDQAALRLYEASLACEFQPVVAELAFQSACQAKDAARARTHYGQLNVPATKRELYRAACGAFGVDL